MPALRSLSSLIFIFFWTTKSMICMDHGSIRSFSREHLGQPISVLGLLKNKKEEKNYGKNNPKPLFEDFDGGEWVAAPLKNKRLCAAIFHSIDLENVDFCKLIIKKIYDEDSKKTTFTLLTVPLTNIFILRKHFHFIHHTLPVEYIGPRETDLHEECIEWLKETAFERTQTEIFRLPATPQTPLMQTTVYDSPYESFEEFAARQDPLSTRHMKKIKYFLQNNASSK